ncbi:DUF3891 family protein [Spirosoma sp. HMF4905]|uniref:DUF3891 family protein n=1 Tax=Spirosoma arboris TaxID=2682092 RepID=A0A7K1S9L6_9BACT|nr:DUF3891 family protein [Spirosoma arboris]MVM30461.1 DUF3891 family protein [Spirosoma arboris]
MIVSSKDVGWEIIHQQAHGLLAFQIAMHWRPEIRPINWVETLVAITEHDDGQDSWQGRNHLTQAGAPMDFQLQHYSVAQARRMVEIALEKSRWNALMVSMHASFLYEPMRDKKKEIAGFLDQQRNNQRDWLRAMKATKQQAQYAYNFLQWCDAFSLILCQDLVPSAGRRIEISLGPDDIAYFLSEQANGSLLVDPWPFDIPSFGLAVEAFQLKQLAFTTDQQLYNAIQQAYILRKAWTISAQSVKLRD